jgi:predicted HTH domain antitoxin
MTKVVFQVPEGVLSSLRYDPERFSHELRLAAAVKWYENGMVSQGRAAEIGGVSRAEFIDVLGRFKVTPFQANADELIAEASHE